MRKTSVRIAVALANTELGTSWVQSRNIAISLNLLDIVKLVIVLFLQIVDIPTVVESLKTIDNKSFYKTADICQVCFIASFCNNEIP